MFVIHRESANPPNIQFRMHESGLHCFDPEDEDFTFVNADFAFINTVAENKEGFTKREIKNAELARNPHATLICPSVKDFEWAIQSNQIKNCPVPTQDADDAQKTWGKDIDALKGKATRRKPDTVARDNVKVPVETLKLHKEAFLAADLFFVNKMPFFLTLSRKTCFAAVNHLADRKAGTIFAAFKEMCQCCLHRG